jgi:hypothetical protein
MISFMLIPIALSFEAPITKATLKNHPRREGVGGSGRGVGGAREWVDKERTRGKGRYPRREVAGKGGREVDSMGKD